MELFQAIDNTYENHMEKYVILDNFLNEYKTRSDFNPNGENDLYSSMWAIQTIIDTTYPNYSNLNVTINNWENIISMQDYLLMRLINEFHAIVDYPLLTRLLKERDSYVMNKNNAMQEMSSPITYKAKRKCMSYD